MDLIHTMLSSITGDHVTDHFTWLQIADILEENGQPKRAELVHLTQKNLTSPCPTKIWKLIKQGILPLVPQIELFERMTFSLIPKKDDAHGAFYMGTTPVTTSQFSAYFLECHNRTFDTILDSTPVTSVSYYEVERFIDFLNFKYADEYTFSLPTVEEWEWAKGEFCVAYGKVAWYSKNCNSKEPVGLLLPNQYGLYDMYGNVWEYCKRENDPLIPSNVPIKGGSFRSGNVSQIRVEGSVNQLGNSGVGFRLVVRPL